MEIGLARRRPTRLAGASIGVGLAVALLACLGAFVDSSVKTMTRRAVVALSIDWQILLNSPSNEGAVRTAIHETDPQAVIEAVAYADVPGLVARTGQTVQTTGEAVVLGVGPGYQTAFPAEIAGMIGSRQGVLAAQQTAANLNTSIGDVVAIQRAAGLPPVEVKIDGIINLPDAESIFQKMGVPSGGRQAPPDNVLVLPVETWQRLFAEQMVLQPGSVRFEDHVRTARREMPSAPETAYAWELRRANHLMLNLAGRGALGDNLAAKLSSVRGDALYARVLFLFLGLPVWS